MPSSLLKRKELLGVGVELLGDLFTVIGYTGQRLATLRAQDKELVFTDDVSCPLRITSYCCGNPRWIAAFFIYALGQALELVALGLASESTVVAIGNLTLVFNAIASVYVFGEDFALTPRYTGLKIFQEWDAFNLFLLVSGSALTVAYAPIFTDAEESELDADELRKMWVESPFIYFNLLVTFSLFILSYFCYKNFQNKDEPKAPMFLASVLSIMAAFSVTLSKVVTELFSKSLEVENQFVDVGALFMLSVWLVLLIMQLVLLNVGLRNFEQGVFVPMFETMSASITIVFGLMYFKSYNDFTGLREITGFISGVIILILGLFLSSRRHSITKEEMVARLERGGGVKVLRLMRVPSSQSVGNDRFQAPLLSNNPGSRDENNIINLT